MRVTYEDYLKHYGVKGMRWGRRKKPRTATGDGVSTRHRSSQVKSVKLSKRTKERAKQPSNDAKNVAAYRAKAKVGKSLDSLSNKELAALNRRMELEDRYHQLSKRRKDEGKERTQAVMNFAKDVGLDIAKDIAKDVVASWWENGRKEPKLARALASPVRKAIAG